MDSLIFTKLQQIHRYARAIFRIFKRMIMISKVIVSRCRHGLQLVVGEPVSEMPSRGRECVMVHIVWIVHLIHLEYRL